MSEVLKVAAAVSAILGAAWLMGKFGAVLWRGFSKVVRLADDALGEPAHGSTPARLGFSDRLTAFSDGLEELRRVVGAIEARLTVVDGIEARLAVLEARFPVEAITATKESA